MLALFLLKTILCAIMVNKIDSSSIQLRLQDACTNETPYGLTNNGQPIHIQNQQPSSSTPKNCKLFINGTVNTSYSIQIDLNHSQEHATLISINNPMDNGSSLLNKTSISELFTRSTQHSIIIEAISFEINLFDESVTELMGFNEVKSITISIANNSDSDPGHVPSKSNNSLKLLIGSVILSALVVGSVFGVWTYRKRRLKWREFLAQLDNNTDWEYEQLDDNHHHQAIHRGQSIPRMSPIFNMNVSSKDNPNPLIN